MWSILTMPLESATYIDGLNVAYPVSTDGVSEGDDHIRLLKSVLKSTFPNINGAMNATEEILNGIDGRVTTLEGTVGTYDNGESVTSISGVLERRMKTEDVAGLNHTIDTADRGRVIFRTHSTNMADTVPQAGASYPNGFFFEYQNDTTTFNLVVTPTTSTINGAASLTILPGHRWRIISDGTNYKAVRYVPVPWKYCTTTTNLTLYQYHSHPPGAVRVTGAGGITIDTGNPASTFTAGALFAISNASSGNVTFDPNGAETVDGASNVVIAAGEMRIFMCDGTNWFTVMKFVNPVAVASTSQMESEATGVYVSPSVQVRHPGSLKAWGVVDGTGVTSILNDWDISTHSDLGVGRYSFTLQTAMSTANYAVGGCAFSNTLGNNTVGGDNATALTTTVVAVGCYNYNSGVNNDMDQVTILVAGDR